MSRQRQIRLQSNGAALRVAAFMRDRLAGWLGYSHEGARDLYAVFGWPRELRTEQLYAMYTRDPIAHRVVNAFSEATWEKSPLIRDDAGSSSDQSAKEFSPWVKEVEELFDNHKILSILERLDRLSTIGRFGILVMGFADGKPLNEPLVGKSKLLYLQPYGEPSASVSRWDTDPQSPRFGKPEIYTVTRNNLGTVGSDAPSSSFLVHHSRVIHVAERTGESEVYGVPRLLPLYNHLLDLQKAVGGSAETFWICANRGLAIWADKETEFDDEAATKVKKQAEEFQHQLRRHIVGQGMTAQVLGGEAPDVEPLTDKLLQLIAGGSGVPLRILSGSERGELASSQDADNWSSRVDERRRNYAIPAVVSPFVQVLIATGNLSEPSGKWWAEWPKGELSVGQQVEIGAKKTDMLTKYANSATAALIIPPSQFVTEVLGMTPATDLESLTAKLQEVPEDDQQPGEEKPGDEEPGDEEPGDEEPGDEEPGDEEPGDKDELAINMTAKPAYVHRRVLNGAAIAKWAKENGFENVLPANSLHVTVCYSEKAFDWAAAGVDYTEEEDGTILVQAGGPRSVEVFGNSVVLEFLHPRLSYRAERMRAAGASFTHEEYRPHVTFAMTNGKPLPFVSVPYPGPIVLGPEIWTDNNEVK